MNANKTQVVVSASPGLFFLFVIFFVLKVTETVAWSWWWVTAPLWLPWVAVLAFMLMIGFFMAVVALFALLKGR
jgi:hypothetical protein